ncbi:hypothetical protein H4S03_005891 [Coemansia sp. S3946]|nr:hypothetical protein H4S03_005891 [Coemansia sp. S3946]
MYAPTPFQFLPPHIVQLIVKYIVGNTRMRFNKDRGDLRRHEELLVPLQWVCHNFRNFVHFRFFSECELFLPFSHAEISDTESSDAEASDAEASDAEASDAEASEAGVSEADVIWPLSPRGRRKGYKGDNGGFPDYTLYNIRDFVGRVAEMATGIGEVFIDMQDETTDGDHEGVYYFNDLFSQLYEIGNMTVLNDPCCKMAPHIDLDFIEDLVRLTCNVDYLSVQLLPLARLSAQTLEYLDIRSLPLLSDLGTGTLGLGELPRDVSMASLPEYVRSNYAPMGKRFRCWHTCYCCENDVTEIVTVVLLLALACPNFDYAALDEDHEREQFMEAMQEKIIEPGFSQDAPRLRRLLLERLVGIYMNVDALECQRIGLGTFNYPINEVSYRRIREFRDSGLGWKDVHQHFMQYPNEKSLQGRYYRFKVKPNGKTTKGLTTEGTDADADLERMKDLIEKHLESTARSELLKAGRMNLDQLTQLRELVAEYGEDWDHIGKVLDVLPSMARYNWITYGGNVGNRFALSSDEARQLQHLVDSGVKYKEAAKLLGIVSPHGYYYKPTKTTSIEDETLLKMIDVSMTSTAAKWELVSKVLGRSVIACKQRLSVINRGHKCEQVDYDRESIVTSEVQRQLESNRTVNWSKVSQATELGLRECLELSQYDDGKASWHYDPDSFSQGMADRMTNFIKEHYPAPVPVIYRAVSNFMWVAMDDCICIHDMLQGKFKWTEADYERATALRAKGLA